MSEKDNKIETIINNFIKQIYELDKSNKKLDEKVKSIDTLVENLIDYCIKKKIFYYVENKIRKHRFGFRKDVLVKEGYDKEKSEHEIMLERKIYRIYNAGNYKFIYKHNLDFII